MSESKEGQVPDVFFITADHVGPGFDDALQLARRAIGGGHALPHVAHYSNGAFDFAVDAFSDELLSRRPRMRDDALVLGRQLAFTATTFDAGLSAARTGPLIRLLVQTAAGAAVCTAVIPNQHVVGLCPDGPTTGAQSDPLPMIRPVREADQAVSALGSQLRHRLRLQSQNPGGWLTADDSEPLSIAPGEPYQLIRVPDAPTAHRITSATTSVLRTGELQFIAYYSADELVMAADTFEQVALQPFFTHITTNARRRFYSSFGHELASAVNRLNRIITPVLEGRLLRLVLDVEQGAVFYYRLGPGRYLVGVTLDQIRVHHADVRMAQLVAECGPHEV